jgi:hypothetical protein
MERQGQVTANFQLAIVGHLDLDSPVARPLIAHTHARGGERLIDYSLKFYYKWVVLVA